MSDLFGKEVKKFCVDCKDFFPLTHFARQYNKKVARWYRGSICKLCRARRCREWNAKHSKGKLLNQNLVKNFGITLEQFNAMLASQNGVCVICGQPPENTNQRNHRLHVDHCHTCGAVRSLLCSKCNNGLGCFRDDPALLLKAISYLNAHTHNPGSRS